MFLKERRTHGAGRMHGLFLKHHFRFFITQRPQDAKFSETEQPEDLILRSWLDFARFA